MLPGVTEFTNPASFIAPGCIANARLIRRGSSAPGIRLTVSVSKPLEAYHIEIRSR
jgi:hypothetical protein